MLTTVNAAMERAMYTFREAQSAFDLIATSKSFDDASLVQTGGNRLVDVVRGSSCRLKHDSDAACYEMLESTALDCAENAALAIAVLVANELQQGLWAGGTKELAEMAAARIRTAHPTLRAAILRGTDTLEDHAYRYEPATYILPEFTRLTHRAEEILPELCQLARSMDPKTRTNVAKADYGDGSGEHLAALNAVLATEDCMFPKDEVWFPSEVVELVAHVRSTPGFVQCTALLLANAIPTNDKMGWFPFRWERLGSEYNALPDSTRSVILAGIRCLYEAEPSKFLPYTERNNWDPVQRPERLISFADMPSG